ncbi:tagatose 1,6-diphosphate aldolase [Meinhardsimonia xiamenensis]|jgi:tagatose 1,6-diphosphate aldolase|uniref:Tagatose 1,6-diphosphate aldolase n=1 Tax=Meinhardsimonia xiamenensis TaxID=990712 RepID=A0A1G9D1Z3_9RHOB|nr:tagatose 1,6-diphosphate aldolase [Meinhardsimonia xiamenensis]PRX38159.1 tagatose 1,6-diphosphate aldolase [Meinhardsimonia xiamenensis]SDK57941.1 tagatose 1,6-diphosphate aldolase [Meinhardsimonia xiamenensis]
MELTPGKLWGLRRLADARGIFRMVAVDQRPPIKGPIARALGVEEAPWEEVARFKALLVETLQEGATALLLDPHYAIPRAIDLMRPALGLVVTLEDSLFEETPGGRLSAEIDDWSVAKIKRMGGDAVKVLAWYRPDAAPEVVAHQKDFVARIGAECARLDIPFLLELLVYPLPSDAGHTTDYVEMGAKRADQVLASVEEFAKPDYGVDIFKLESPVPAAAADGSAEVQALFDEMGRLAGRPWVMLSAGAGKEEFARVLDHAFRAGASGFLAGRAIWADAFAAYPDWEVIRAGLEGEARDYLARISAMAAEKALPWSRHPCYGEGGARFTPADASFRHVYGEF